MIQKIHFMHQLNLLLCLPLAIKISSILNLGNLGIVHMFISQTTTFQVSLSSFISAMEFNLRNSAKQTQKL